MLPRPCELRRGLNGYRSATVAATFLLTASDPEKGPALFLVARLALKRAQNFQSLVPKLSGLNAHTTLHRKEIYAAATSTGARSLNAPKFFRKIFRLNIAHQKNLLRA
jgi:hypothetical protein